MLDYEKLDVYQAAIEHLAAVLLAIPRLPKGHAPVVDQWRRAAMSIPLNIAEAVGKTSQADRANRFAIARGEAMECGAIADVTRMLGAISEQEQRTIKTLLIRIVGMLTKLCR